MWGEGFTAGHTTLAYDNITSLVLCPGQPLIFDGGVTLP